MVFMLSHQIMEKTGNYLVSSHLVSPALLPMSKGGHLNLEGVEFVKLKIFMFKSLDKTQGKQNEAFLMVVVLVELV